MPRVLNEEGSSTTMPKSAGRKSSMSLTSGGRANGSQLALSPPQL